MATPTPTSASAGTGSNGGSATTVSRGSTGKRVLIIGDVAHTGFGRVTRELGMGLRTIGHDVRILGINFRGIQGEIGALLAGPEPLTRERIERATAEVLDDPLVDVIVSASEHGDGMGNNLTASAYHGKLIPGWRPEACIVVADPKAMLIRLSLDGGAIGARHIPTFNYVPIEGPLPPASRIIWDHAIPVAMSDYGQRELATLLGHPVDVAYHGVSDIFRPVSMADPCSWLGRLVMTKDGAKEAIGLGGRTVILRTDRMIPRKNYSALFRVMRPVLAAHPEAVLVIHAALNDEGGDLRELVSWEPGAVHEGGLDWDHPQILLTKAHDTWRGLSDADLRTLYNAADLYVSPTQGEGFGLCLAEAQACGVPVVATDYSAVSEVVRPTEALIAPRGTTPNVYGSEWALVDEAAMSAVVERLVSKPALRRAWGEEGRRHVARYTWSRAVEQFDALISSNAAVAA